MGTPDSPLFHPNRPKAETNIILFVTAEEAWKAIHDEVVRATRKDDFIVIAGWHLFVRMPLLVGKGYATSLAYLLSQQREITTRALLDEDPQPGSKRTRDNREAVDFLWRLPNGSGLLDLQTLTFGTFHQKAVVIQNDTGLHAFVTGIDIHPDRTHWRDASLHCSGGAAFSVLETLEARWKSNTVAMPWPADKKSFPVAGTASSSRKANATVQVVRTYGNPKRHGGGAGSRTYAPDGEFTMYETLIGAIDGAREFVYCEDQYFYATTMANLPDRNGNQPPDYRDPIDVIARRLEAVPRLQLIVVMSRTEDINAEVQQAWTHRKRIVDKLNQTVGPKVSILQPRKRKNTNGDEYVPYIHTKAWVIDDSFAILGSANCNRRGYSHDGELDVAYTGGEDTQSSPQQLRVKLWLKHLNTDSGQPPVKEDEIRDWRTGLSILKRSGSMLEPYDPNAGKDDKPQEWKWDRLYDPDGS
jgi:phosphatidylserine/phosphatidylglycerophosphate/cardiolipin synthase-like enzyme